MSDSTRDLGDPGQHQSAAPPPATASRPPAFKVRVSWGDIGKATGHLLSVGHYVEILPQNAEWALDKVVSQNPDGAPELDDDRHVLTRLTRENVLRGNLGDINLFPVASSAVPANQEGPRLVAICGMGHPNEFDEFSLRTLYRNLAMTADLLPEVTEVSTVLIGSGEGCLRIDTALRELIGSFRQTLQGTDKIQWLQIVEYSYARAQEILHALQSLCPERLEPNHVVEGGGANHDIDFWGPHLLQAALAAGGAHHNTNQYRALATVLEKGLPAETFPAALDWVSKNSETDLVVTRGKTESGGETSAFSSRISVFQDAQLIRMSAITQQTTVSERVISRDVGLIREAVSGLQHPADAELQKLSNTLTRLVVPRDFRTYLADPAPLVLELDRNVAVIPWELMRYKLDDEKEGYLSLKRPLARQLRTTRSPLPRRRRSSAKLLKALIVGDPGEGIAALPGARDEAIAVARFLEGKVDEVTLLLGPPDHRPQQLGPGSEWAKAAGVDWDGPATRFSLLHHLSDGYDLVHFCGHGDFDSHNPTRSGWVFAGGMLTASEIETIDNPPTLVFANACWSGKLSQTDEDPKRAALDERTLLPSLADEFFHQGVQNYIGTAWKVDDRGAVDFAKDFYEMMLNGDSIGTALQVARQNIFPQNLRALWAAYQHYGDPACRLV